MATGGCNKQQQSGQSRLQLTASRKRPAVCVIAHVSMHEHTGSVQAHHACVVATAPQQRRDTRRAQSESTTRRKLGSANIQPLRRRMTTAPVACRHPSTTSISPHREMSQGNYGPRFRWCQRYFGQLTPPLAFHSRSDHIGQLRSAVWAVCGFWDVLSRTPDDQTKRKNPGTSRPRRAIRSVDRRSTADTLPAMSNRTDADSPLPSTTLP